MTRFFCILPGVAALVLTVRCASAEPADDLIKAEMQKHLIPGLELKVLRDGEAIKTTGYGVANLEWNVPVTEETVFEIGSITKQFTAACILLLAEDGKLSINDKISQHLSNTPAAWSNITIRHLLTHTSGITNYTTIDGFELRLHLTQEQFIKRIGAYPLAFQPGDSWKYCNSGYNLLGFIVENASGKNYWDFIQERIFQPLQMTHTTTRTPGIIVSHRAAGYEFDHRAPINRDYDLTDLFSAGAIISTVEDMAKWDAALNGQKLLNTSSKEQWWTPTKLNSGKSQNYGFGWFIDSVQGHKNIGHGGATSGFSASIQRFPDDHLSVIILCNSDETGVATTLAKEVAPLYFADRAAK